MKLSKRIIIFSKNPHQDIIFDTLTKKILVIDKNMGRKLTNNKIAQIPQKMKKLLITEGILLGSGLNENELAEYWCNEFKFRREINVTILTTYACNLACSYCYEKNSSQKNYSLTDKTTNEMIKFLKNLVMDRNPRLLTIEFYGGEPLLRYDLIKKISRELKTTCDRQGTLFTFGIMTNGILLTKRTVSTLKDFGLWRIQLTLDGPSEIHNIRKPLKSGGGTFKKIIHTIKTISDEIIPIVRVNVDDINADYLPELITVLKQSGIHKKIAIYFVPTIYEHSQNVIQCNPNIYLSNKSIIKKIKRAIKIVKKENIRLANRYYATAPCHFYQDNSFIIDPLGDIYKCLALPETKVGNVRKNYFNSKHAECVETNPWKNRKCLGCKYLFLCWGGCRYQAKIKTGNTKAVFCDRVIFDQLTPELITA